MQREQQAVQGKYLITLTQRKEKKKDQSEDWVFDFEQRVSQSRYSPQSVCICSSFPHAKS